MKLEQKMMLWSDRKAAPGETDSFQPYLTPYLLPGDKVRGCVIVLPGGGYHARAPHEGGVVAERFNSLGFHAFVLEYRVAPYRWPAPQEDALRAVKIVRAHADEWKIKPDKIAVLGRGRPEVYPDGHAFPTNTGRRRRDPPCREAAGMNRSALCPPDM